MTKITRSKTRHTYVKNGKVMTRARQALVMMYRDRQRRLDYGPISDTGRMPNDQWERYQEWLDGFLKPY